MLVAVMADILKSLGFKLTDSEIIGIDQSVPEITKLNEEFSDSSL